MNERTESVPRRPQIFEITWGRVTWDAEGEEGGQWHSRIPHVPGPKSGLTIGRGYDLGRRSHSVVAFELIAAGVDIPTVQLLAPAAGLIGAAAQDYCELLRQQNVEITPGAQLRLFFLVYPQYVDLVRRISAKADVIELYGETNWTATHQAIKDVMVDLAFRGDYTPRTRRLVQWPMAANSIDELYVQIADPNNWPGVPRRRQRARAEYLAPFRQYPEHYSDPGKGGHRGD
jgi:hypothetical protein